MSSEGGLRGLVRMHAPAAGIDMLRSMLRSMYLQHPSSRWPMPFYGNHEGSRGTALGHWRQHPQHRLASESHGPGWVEGAGSHPRPPRRGAAIDVHGLPRHAAPVEPSWGPGRGGRRRDLPLSRSRALALSRSRALALALSLSLGGGPAAEDAGVAADALVVAAGEDVEELAHGLVRAQDVARAAARLRGGGGRAEREGQNVGVAGARKVDVGR